MSAGLAFGLPVVLGILAGVGSLALDAFGRAGAARGLGATGLAAAAVVAMFAAIGVEPATVWGHFQVGAGYSGASAVVFALAVASVVASSGATGSSNSGTLVGLVGFAAVAASVLAQSTDAVTVLIALEILAATSYALVALAGTPRAHEAAMKYFVQGAIATAMYVAGLAVCLFSGSVVVTHSGLAGGIIETQVAAATAGVALIVAALAFKLGAFPFHAWAPDAYETAPPEAAAFLASAPKVAAVVAAYTLVWQTFGRGALAPRGAWFFGAIAAASVVFGNLAGLAQRDFARLLAYSGIAQMGYALTALVVGNGSAALMFSGAYGLAACGAFVAVAAFRRLAPEWDGSVSGLAGFARRAPLLCGTLAVLLFSLTGIPPLFGFWGKFVVFLTAASDPAWLWLVVLGLVGSVVSFGYYGRVLRVLYFEEPGDAGVPRDDSMEAPDGAPTHPAGSRGGAPVWVAVALAVVLVLAGLMPLIGGFDRLLGSSPTGVFAIGELLLR